MLTQSFRVNYLSANKLIDRRTPTFYCNEHLYQAVLENLTDGILVLTETGQQVYSNLAAQKICAQLNPDTSNFDIPKEIWEICQTLASVRRILPVEPTILTSEIWVNRLTMLRIRVQWLKLQEENNYVLVALEDCHQSNRDRAVAEMKQYGLTARESEVWLLRREGYSYREIAARLYVAINTVKKHLKQIYSKQKAYLDVAE